MISIELSECGFDAALQEIRNNLQDALDKKKSKYDKDKLIAYALGAIDTLLSVSLIEEYNE